MASTAYNDIHQLTPSNQGITNLRELLFLQTLANGSLSEVLNIVYGARNGKIVGGIGEFGLVGENAPMCNPTWNATNLGTAEKKWALGPVMIKEQLCADDFTQTVAQFSMGAGTDKADMTDDDLMTYIVEPRLLTAWEKALWRVYFFGDTEAANFSASGDITNGYDVKFFNMADGIFKRLYAIAPSGSAQHVEIAANAAATYAEQRSELYQPGVPRQIIDDLIYNADMRLRRAGDRELLITQSLADALAWDIKQSCCGSDLAWEAQLGGMTFATRYNGENLIAMPIWDEMIREFHNNGTKWIDPHRAVFASKQTLMAGIESESMMATLRVWFSPDTQTNRILARDEVGTLIWEDYMTMFAY